MYNDHDTEVICIMGTARSDGHTTALVEKVLNKLDKSTLIDLNQYDVRPYHYGLAQEDDFLSIAKKMDQARIIIFATPVYWYSMSGTLKIFFDRLTDLTDHHKAIGKNLAGKTMFSIVAGGNLPDYFNLPFIETAQYFNMHWGDSLFAAYQNDYAIDFDINEKVDDFIQKISTCINYHSQCQQSS